MITAGNSIKKQPKICTRNAMNAARAVKYYLLTAPVAFIVQLF